MDREDWLGVVDDVFDLPVPEGTPCAQEWRREMMKKAIEFALSVHVIELDADEGPQG